MAALCTGNYGLSQNNTDNSKEYFFVKLTGSAYRAVEEYQKNQSKSNTQATIQILGSGGVLSFPSQSGNGGQQFSFSIDDIEGSFECIQQTQNQLSVLGSLPYKMRIHANEDVYETTRHRMAVAEETKKNTCTREIKPNQTDIGRKVKLKNSSGRLTNIPPKRDLTNTSLSPLPSSVSNLNSMSSNINPLLSGTSSTISSSTTSLNIQSSSSNNLMVGGGGIGSSTISGTTGLLPITNTISSSVSNNNTNNNNNNNNNTTSNSSLKNSNSSNSLNSLSNTNINSNSSLKLHHHPHQNNHHQNYNSSTTNSSGVIGGGGGVSSASSLSSVLSSAAGSGTSGINSGYFSNNSSSNNNNNNNNNNSGLRNGTNVLGNNTSSSGSRRGAQISGGPIGGNRNQRNGSSRHTPDITKKKIRERLIHLLALKPFKKPELYARLQNEGIREREKNLISGILKDISTMRDNTYNLKRQIWNDVNEDWPFYTEQELQMLKRRKPQNLTPPLSSDGGSSTSGQSPTSTHNGSPPPAVKRPSLDRERFYEEPTAKKQRISHFRKESNEINRRSGLTDSRDSSNMNPRSRENHDMRSSSYYGSNIIAPSKPQHHEPAEDNAMSISYAVLGSEAARRISPREEMMNSQHFSSNNHHSPNINNNSNKNISNNGNVGHHQSPTSYNNNNNNNTNNNISSNHINGNNINPNSDSRRKSSSPMTSSLIGNANAGIGASSPGAGSRTSNSNINNNNNINNNSSTMSGGIADRGSAIIVNNNHNNINNNINQGSNSSRNINNNNNNNNNISNNINNNINNINGGPLTKISYDFSKFTKIKSIEQRRLYKTEFENDYDEYRQLLNKIENVRKRFNMLAERLHNARNNDANYRTIRRQILSEYEMINGEQEHQRAKARFDYLHAKLAHIKALVSEFDKTITSPNPNGDGTTNNNNNNNNRRIQQSSSSSPIQNFSGNNLLNGGGGGIDNNGRTNCHSPSQQSLKISPNRNGKLPSPLSGSGLPSSSSSSMSSSHYLPKQENY